MATLTVRRLISSFTKYQHIISTASDPFFTPEFSSGYSYRLILFVTEVRGVEYWRVV